MRTHTLRFAALAAALLVFGAMLSAQGRGAGMGPRPGRGFLGLNLTTDQQAQVKAIHQKHQAAIQAKRQATQAARQEMRQAMAKAETDATTLQTLHQKVSSAQFELMLEHRAVRTEILPLLTADQKALFEKRAQGAGFGAGMGPRGGRGRGQGRGPGTGFGPGMNPDCPLVK